MRKLRLPEALRHSKWLYRRADYLGQTEHGTNVVSVNTAGARSGKMVEYLGVRDHQVWGHPRRHLELAGGGITFAENGSTKEGDFRKAPLSPSCYIVMLHITG